MPGCIYFVIINWNLKQDTADCIESLQKSGLPLNQVTVVDNGSTDGSVSFLQALFDKKLDIVALEENSGFAKGSNMGIQRAIARNAEWIFLMNNDTIVDRGFVAQLEKAVATGKKTYHLFSPLILYHSQPDTIWYLGDHIVPGTMIGVNRYVGKKVDQIPSQDLMEIDFVNGCGMLVHRDVYEKAGMMDTSLFIYHEEVDFCWRARLAGFKMAAVPTAIMWHKISSVMGKQKPKTRYLQTRNQIWVYRRYSRGLQKGIMFIFTILKAFRLIWQDLRMHQLYLFPYLWRGWWEGWTANPKQGEY